MAGTLTISTLSDGTNSTSCTNVINGAKVWVRWNGNGVATINASYNVSSVTRNSTGNYTINFTNALTDANYSSVMSVGILGSTASSNSVMQINDNTAAPTASALRVQSSLASNGVAWEPSIAAVAIFR